MTAPWIAAFGVLWTVVILLALLVLGVLRRLIPVIAQAEEALHQAAEARRHGGLPVGSVVPQFW